MIGSTALLAFFSIAVVSFAAEQQEVPLFLFLPEGETEIESLDIKFSQRYEELAAKFQAGVQQAGREWLVKYIAENDRSGEALPYHPKFGLTQAEYNEMLAESNKGANLQPTGVVWQCNIEIQNDIIYFKPIGKQSLSLSGIKVHLPSTKAMAAETKLGAATWNYRPDAAGAIGPWCGYQWKYEDADIERIQTGQPIRLVTLDLLHPLNSQHVHLSQKTTTEDGSKEIMFRYKSPGIQEASAKLKSQPR